MRPSEFLRKLREDMGLTLEKISKETGIPASTISSWERGAGMPKGKNLRKISDYYGFSPESLSELKSISNPTIPIVAGFRKIPVVSWTTAGRAKSFEDLGTFIDEMVDSATKDPNSFAIEVVGDSMEGLVLGGDRVVVEPNREATNGDMAYVRFSDEAGGGGTLKWFYRTGPRAENVKLVAENEKHEPKEEEVPGKMILFAYPVINIVRRVQKRRS